VLGPRVDVAAAAPTAAVDALAPAANVAVATANGARGPIAGWEAPASERPSSPSAS
jgi:hypothetical protein